MEQAPHDQIQSTVLLAVQAVMRVSVPPFTQVHHQVHGHVPDTAVGVPVEQVAVGRAYELKATLHDPLIQAALALKQAVAVVEVHPFDPLHHHVAF